MYSQDIPTPPRPRLAELGGGTSPPATQDPQPRLLRAQSQGDATRILWGHIQGVFLNPVSVLFQNRKLTRYYQLRAAMAAQLQNSKRELDILQWTNRGALEVMGQAGLGYSFDSLEEHSSNEFARALKGLLYVPPPSLASLAVAEWACIVRAVRRCSRSAFYARSRHSSRSSARAACGAAWHS